VVDPANCRYSPFALITLRLDLGRNLVTGNSDVKVIRLRVDDNSGVTACRKLLNSQPKAPKPCRPRLS